MPGGIEKGPLVYRERERAPLIAQAFLRSGADVVGGCELFDEQLVGEMTTLLAERFPYHTAAPFQRGIVDVEAAMNSRWWLRPVQWLLPPTDRLVDIYAKGHYGHHVSRLFSGLLTYIGGEDRFFAASHWMLGNPLCWGSGLSLWSRYPLSNTGFKSYGCGAGLERYADKGVLFADVAVPGAQPFKVLVTHLQEGVSSWQTVVRQRQVAHIKLLGGDLVLGDFNIDECQNHLGGRDGVSCGREPCEYQELFRTLGFTDAFRVIHPDSHLVQGGTYIYGSHFADKMGGEGDARPPQGKIDYVLVNGGVRVAHAGIPEDLFLDVDRQPLADHRPLMADLEIR